MALEIVLYDTSPIVQKIFSHVLYHYAPVIYRTNQPNDLVAKVRSGRPDLVFIDYSVSQQADKKISEEIVQVLQSVPVILMSQKDMNDTEMPYAAKDCLKKPIEAVQLKELVNRFVPKTKSHLLKDHLQFPPMPNFDEEQKSTISIKDDVVDVSEQRDQTVQRDTQEGQSPEKMNAQKNQSAKVDIQDDEKKDRIIDSNKKPMTSSKPSTGIQIEPISESEAEIPSIKQSVADLKDKDDSPISAGSGGVQIQPVDGNQEEELSISQKAPSIRSKMTNDLENEKDSPISSDSGGGRIQPVDGNQEEELSISQKASPPDKALADDSEDVKMKIFTASPSVQAKKDQSNVSKSVEMDLSMNHTKTYIQDALGSSAQDTAMKKTDKVSPEQDGQGVMEQKVATVEDSAKNVPEKQILASKEMKSKYSIRKNLVDSAQLLSKDDLEKKIAELFEKEGKKVIQSTTEKVVWQVVPELAKQLIEKELEKLLKEDKS